jgi:RNA polymerase sigma-32 factor
LAEKEELGQRRAALKAAIETLSPRERHIFTARHLAEAPPKLETLAVEYGISRERIRQIELRAFEKVRSAMHGQNSQNDWTKQNKRQPSDLL